MRNSFSHRHGAAPFAEMVAEVQYLSQADNELMYTAAANSYGQTGLQQFSSFDDPKGYAGSPPSAPYLKGLFTDVVSAHRVFIERDTATKPLTIAKADHTFDGLKHMGGVKGERIFTAAYTCMNEFEEARGHSIVYSKSLEHVEDMYEYMFQGLEASQNPPTQILYTDSPQGSQNHFPKNWTHFFLPGERSFHERINTAMTLNVVPVTEWTDLPRFAVQPNIATVLVSDSIQIEDAANEILHDFFGYSSPSQLYLVALAIKSEQRAGELPRLHFIQLRTRNKIYIFKARYNTVSQLRSPSDVLPSLRSILTNSSIIKIGHDIRRSLQTISQAFSIQDIEASLAGKNPSILDLAKYAKLKGRVDSPLASLHDLAGAILHKSFSIPAPTTPWVAPSSQTMSAELECLWEIYVTLSKLDSVGLRLQQTQAETNGQLVTLVQACKPVAEGSIVGQHEGYLDAVMDDEGNTKRINISRSRSLIKISKVLVPGAIHALHKQTMEWIMAHGSFAVVTTSQLHSRSETPPQSVSTAHPAFATPAPVVPADVIEEFTPTRTSSSSDIEFEPVVGSVNLNEEDMDDSDLDGEDVLDSFEDPTPGEAQPVSYSWSMESVESESDSESEPLPSRVLDDAFHFMDRLLRLLSKKHSAFKAFSHDFSEAIFIRDRSD
ncbi:hypothetical protein R3P38DRAFT_3590324, partial [Favolaschia claudopus]